MSLFRYLPICSLLVVEAGMRTEKEVQRTYTQLIGTLGSPFMQSR
jgi:hypothetical protein